jgi:hypothetical protein
MAARTIIRIRVTTDAVRDSMLAAPITPERSRTLGRLMALEGGAVEAEPSNALELLVHPEDYQQLLWERDEIGRSYGAGIGGEITRIMGLRVVRS